MPSLPIPINDGTYDFFTSQYFAITVIDTIDGSTLDLGRAVFKECSGLEVEREVKDYTESGHSEPYQHGDKIKYSDVTLKRGFSYDPVTMIPHNHLFNWFKAGTKANLLVELFPPNEGDGTLRQAIKKWRLKLTKPKKIKLWEGNSDNADITVQELVISVSKIDDAD